MSILQEKALSTFGRKFPQKYSLRTGGEPAFNLSLLTIMLEVRVSTFYLESNTLVNLYHSFKRIPLDSC
jgi:hypothetical protein